MKGLRVALQGFCAAHTELTTSKAGKPMLRLRIGVADVGGDDDTEWVTVYLTGDKADKRLADKLPKGAEVYAEGNLKVDRWKTSEGEARTTLTLLAWTVQPIGQIGRRESKGMDDRPSTQEPSQPARPREMPIPTGAREHPATWNDDDVPF